MYRTLSTPASYVILLTLLNQATRKLLSCDKYHGTSLLVCCGVANICGPQLIYKILNSTGWEFTVFHCE